LKPPGDCTQARWGGKQDKVNFECKAKLEKCSGTDSKDVLNSKIGQFSRCMDARKDINTACFKGGDIGHKEAINSANNGINTCKTYLAKAK